jgi:hypothetical protein
LNLDHQAMMASRLRQGGQPFPSGTTQPGLPCVDLNRQSRPVDTRLGDVQTIFPSARGPVDYLATRTCPCPELAVASTSRVSPMSTKGAPIPERHHAACVHSPHRDPGIAAGCKIPATRASASPCLCRVVLRGPFDFAVQLANDPVRIDVHQQRGERLIASVQRTNLGRRLFSPSWPCQTLLPRNAQLRFFVL